MSYNDDDEDGPLPGDRGIDDIPTRAEHVDAILGKRFVMNRVDVWQQQTKTLEADLKEARNMRDKWIAAALSIEGVTEREVALAVGVSHAIVHRISKKGQSA